MWILRTDAGEVPSGLGWGFVGGWLLRRRNSAKTASKILKLASEAAQTARIFEATQISSALKSENTISKNTISK